MSLSAAIFARNTRETRKVQADVVKYLTDQYPISSTFTLSRGEYYFNGPDFLEIFSTYFFFLIEIKRKMLRVCR